jgi:hypothetical protein
LIGFLATLENQNSNLESGMKNNEKEIEKKAHDVTAKPSPQTSSIYREFLAERDEILRHKWIQSEKAGENVGFEKALLDWVSNHRADWRRSRVNV